MSKFKNPRRQLPALLSHQIDPTTVIKIRIDNQLPEGLLIRPIYENDIQEPDLFIKDPGFYSQKIKPSIIKNGAFFLLTELLFIDYTTGKIEKNIAANELTHINPQQKIVLVRSRSQLPPLEKKPKKNRSIRHSPTSILSSIAEEDENNKDTIYQVFFTRERIDHLREKRTLPKQPLYYPTRDELETRRKAYQKRLELPPLIDK